MRATPHLEGVCVVCDKWADTPGAVLYDHQRVPHPKTPSVRLATDAKARKDTPIARGVLDYFPNALAAVAELSRIGNEQHNPGQPMHWAKEKSTDHADCIVRHLIDRGTIDTDGVRHATKVAWRALALLQTEIEAATQSTRTDDR